MRFSRCRSFRRDRKCVWSSRRFSKRGNRQSNLPASIWRFSFNSRTYTCSMIFSVRTWCISVCISSVQWHQVTCLCSGLAYKGNLVPSKTFFFSYFSRTYTWLTLLLKIALSHFTSQSLFAASEEYDSKCEKGCIKRLNLLSDVTWISMGWNKKMGLRRDREVSLLHRF